MSTRHQRAARSVVVQIDLGRVRQILDQARTLLSSEDVDCLVGVVDTLLEVSKALQDERATLARVRRLFGLSSSEKTVDVLGRTVPRAPEQDAGEVGAASAEPPGCATPTPGCEATGADAHASASAEPATPNTSAETESTAQKPKRKGHGRIPCSAYTDVCVKTVSHVKLRVGAICPSCAHGKLYNCQPMRIIRLVGQAPLTAERWDCEQLRCSGCSMVHTATPPAEAQGPKCTDSGAAMLAILRYRAGLPLNRLAQLQCSMGTPLPASTQWEIVRDRLPAVEPVYEELFGCAADGHILHTDDTNMPVLELMGKRRAALVAGGKLDDPDRTGLFTTGVVSLVDQRLIALFFTGRQHAGENLDQLLDARTAEREPPIHMCDGLNRNRPKEHAVIEAACMAHGRRNFVDEVSNFPDECRHVLEQLAEVFANDVECKKLHLAGHERLLFHQEHSADVMANLKAWMNAQLDEKKVEPNSGLGTAFRYLLKRWDQLTLFLHVPDAPLENNRCERILKMAIRHRNNSLFYRSLKGAHVGDVYMSLIHTAELNGENPFDYLVALFANEAEVSKNPSAWLPWTFRAALTALVAARAAA